MRARQVLTIDGGGIKGVFPLALLATVEAVAQRPIHEYFDLIVGTSTGGIISLGLGLGYSASDLLGFYRNLGREVFGGNRLARMARRLVVPKYHDHNLHKVLFEKFEHHKLGDSKARLVIPSLNFETGKVHLFKTAHHVRFMQDYQKEMVEVAMATAAAPTYFPIFRSSSQIPFVDGGIWANNPVGIAAVEAVVNLEWPREQIRILSLGCTNSPVQDRRRSSRLGIIGWWDGRIIDYFMTAQDSASFSIANLLIGKTNIQRIDPSVNRNRFELDDVNSISDLEGLGRSEGRTHCPELMQTFFSQPVPEFVPFHHTIESVSAQYS